MRRLGPAAAISLALASCTGGVVLHALPVASPDVRVAPTEAVIYGTTLQLKLTVQNTSNATLILERDQITLRLRSGQTLTRDVGRPYGEGMWGSYHGGGGWVTHEPYVLLPGALRPVDIGFESAGFRWNDVRSVQIDFDGAITRGGERVTVPPLVVSR